MGDTLQKGEKLEVGQSLTSNNGAYRLVLQDDGNLVLYAGEQSVWATVTDGQDVKRAEVQEDGNFVLYTPDKPVWASQTAGADNVRLVLQDDRNLVLYSGDDAKWSSETHTDEVPAAPVEAAPVADDWAAIPGLVTEPVEGELAWQADALCAQTDPEAFFPEKGGSTRDAKRVCEACTVKDACLEYAMANDERFGIWGGLSERERRRLRRAANDVAV